MLPAPSCNPSLAPASKRHAETVHCHVLGARVRGEAFAKLPKGTVEALLKDKHKLMAVLTYHVVAGKVMASDAAKLASAKTVNGQSLTIKASKDSIKIDGATVVKADIEASNGVIHVIDSVILPR